MVAFPFKVEYGIGDMFQGFRSSNSAFFGNMTNNEDRRVCTFCQLHELQGTFTYLTDATRGGCQMAGKDGLDGVDDHQGWFQTCKGLGNHIKLNRG